MAAEQNTITPYQAIMRMRELTKAGIPFSIEFLSYNSTKQTTGGFKRVEKVQLRKGLRNNQSDKSNLLVAYTDYSQGDVNRMFYLPLLMKFNQFVVKP